MLMPEGIGTDKKDQSACNTDMKGQLRPLILQMLAEDEEQSGSTIADKIEERVGHRPSPGTLYPMLDRMADDDLIEKEKVGRENKYTLIEHGNESMKSFMEENSDHLEGIIESMRKHREIFGQDELQVHIDRLERMQDNEFPESELESLVNDIDVRIQSSTLEPDVEEAIKEKLREIENLLSEE